MCVVALLSDAGHGGLGRAVLYSRAGGAYKLARRREEAPTYAKRVIDNIALMSANRMVLR